MKLNRKQTQALDYLEDKITTELLYGGGAGGGKSILGCYWLLKMAVKYPGTRWLMGRASLKTLKETTLVSFFKVTKIQGLKAGVHYRYVDNPKNVIEFPNGSQIILKDLAYYPSDPEFDELGSLEITGAFIDEANQITQKAKNIVFSRIRHMLDENGLIPKVLMTCNPAKNWTYTEFYRAARDGKIAEFRKFIKALVTDNPDISRHYRENLLKLDKASKERLLYGNWEYDDDPATMIEYDKILDLFTNTFVPYGPMRCTVDVARFGKDKTVVIVWSGLRAKIFTFSKQGLDQTVKDIKQICQDHKIPINSTIADEDGVGGGVVDFAGCLGFVNNSTPLDVDGIRPNYGHLKDQCYYELARIVNNSEMYIECDDPEVKQRIIQELEQVKRYEVDKDGKLKVIPKDKVKELLGWSPDYADALMMRMYFALAPTYHVGVF